jgi:hypothetical protein
MNATTNSADGSPPRIVAVVASNREAPLQRFLQAWQPYPWNDIVVIEDGASRSFNLAPFAPSLLHLSWSEIEADPDVIDRTVFSRGDSAIKCYGFWVALRRSADVVIALDDDCLPTDGPAQFINGHLAALAPRPRWMPSIADNPTRGVPYFDLGSTPGTVANMGLWRGVGDFDAPQTLALHRLGALSAPFESPRGNRLMHPDHYWPWCAMNISFRREIAPLMYMPKMGQDSPYRRFDDIWCGVILQRCCRHLRLALSAGEPHILHERASHPLMNLEKEAPGIRANEVFWKIIESTPLSKPAQTTPLQCAEAVAAHLGSIGQNDDTVLADNPTLAAYFMAESVRMANWCKMFRNAGWA